MKNNCSKRICDDELSDVGHGICVIELGDQSAT